MLTGDNTRTAHALAAEAGIKDVRAQLRPEDKAQAIADLHKSGPVAMIGDGINDAPALASADIGIAIGDTGSDAAIESADVAFTGDDLRLISPGAAPRPPRTKDHQPEHHFFSDDHHRPAPQSITDVLGLAAVVLVHEVAEVIVITNGLRAARTATTTHPDCWSRLWSMLSRSAMGCMDVHRPSSISPWR